VHNRDLYAFMSSDAPIDTVMARLALLPPVIDDEIARRTVDIERVQRALPPFVLDVNAGSNNFITDILGESKMGFRSLSMTAANDSSAGVQRQCARIQHRIDEARYDRPRHIAVRAADDTGRKVDKPSRNVRRMGAMCAWTGTWPTTGWA